MALAERGHHVHLAADEPEALGGQELVERLAARYPGVTFGFAPSLDDEPWFRLARKLRTASDYVRFHDDAVRALPQDAPHAEGPRAARRRAADGRGRRPQPHGAPDARRRAASGRAR